MKSAVKNDMRKVKEETDQINKAKGEICLQLLDKPNKITYLESDSSTLSQTLELMQQEKLSLSAKLVDRRTNYEKVGEDFSQQLKEQQVNKRADVTKEFEDEVGQHVMLDFQAAQTKYDTVEQLKSSLVLKNTENVSHTVKCSCGEEYIAKLDV